MDKMRARIELRAKWTGWHNAGEGHSLHGRKPLDIALMTARALAASGAWVCVLDEEGAVLPPTVA